MKRTRLIYTFLALTAAAFAQTTSAATVEVTANIATGTSVNWTADNVYLMKKVIYVETNAVLRIEPDGDQGAKVVTRSRPQESRIRWRPVGDTGRQADRGRDGEQPIIFTRKTTMSPIPRLPLIRPGLGRVVLMGNARSTARPIARGTSPRQV